MTQNEGPGQRPVEIWIPARPQGSTRTPPYWTAGQMQSRSSLALAIFLFTLTVISTLAVGTQFASAYAAGHSPDFNNFFASYVQLLAHPRLLVAGIPFAFTLLGILLAHELGHFFACRYYGIAATYPFFIPAPTLIGTLGAFIRIRSPIVSRRALFDVGIAGPVVGFIFAIPALAIGLAHSKIVPGADAASVVQFGHPLALTLLLAVIHPGVSASDVLLHPIARGAWVGLFATALNLIPAGQLDGGHILYAVASRRHKQISLGVAIALVPLAIFAWWGWLVWAALLFALRFRHPPLLDPWTPVGREREVWALIAIAIFLLCFMPSPIVIAG
ncbi:MAG: site-2 protease family protein [Candidatus Acidiferrales bacterium]